MLNSAVHEISTAHKTKIATNEEALSLPDKMLYTLTQKKRNRFQSIFSSTWII